MAGLLGLGERLGIGVQANGARKNILLCGGGGQTTLMVWLKLGQRTAVENVAPSTTFSVAEVTYEGAHWKLFDKPTGAAPPPGWSLREEHMDAIIFVIDAADRRPDATRAAMQELRHVLEHTDLAGKPIAVLANKQDRPTASSAAQLSQLLSLDHLIHDRSWVCLPLTATTGEGVAEVLAWVGAELTTAPRGGPPAAVDLSRQVRSWFSGRPTPADALQEWLAHPPLSDERVIRGFEHGSRRCDHFTAVRLAYAYKGSPRFGEQLRTVFHGCRDLLEAGPSPVTDTHETLCAFWCHIVRFAVQTAKAAGGAAVGFNGFLRLSPHLADPKLWKKHYSKALMKAPGARTAMFPPDKKPLPSVVNAPPAKRPSAAGGGVVGLPTAHTQSDARFVRAFEGGELRSWNHYYMLRVVYSYLIMYGPGAVDQIILSFQSAQKDAFHFSIVYFWIRMLTYAMGQHARLAPLVASPRLDAPPTTDSAGPSPRVRSPDGGATAPARVVAGTRTALSSMRIARIDSILGDAGSQVASPASTETSRRADALRVQDVDEDGPGPAGCASPPDTPFGGVPTGSPTAGGQPREGGEGGVEALTPRAASRGGSEGSDTSREGSWGEPSAAPQRNGLVSLSEIVGDAPMAFVGGESGAHIAAGERLVVEGYVPGMTLAELAELPSFQAFLEGDSFASRIAKRMLEDEKLYLRWYSRDVVFGAEAAEALVAPDLRPLPSLNCADNDVPDCLSPRSARQSVLHSMFGWARTAPK